MPQDNARELTPVVFFEKGERRPVTKDFSIRQLPADVIVPELEPDLVAELQATAGTDESEGPDDADIVEESTGDPKDSSATGSAEYSDLIPGTEEVSVEAPVPPAPAAKVPSPPSTEPSKQTSSPPTKSGSSGQSAVKAPATTPASGSARQQKTATKPN